MNPLQQLLASEETILLDGAMGTMLFDAGLAHGAAPEEWNVTHPERIETVHRAYIEAGSRIVLTNSFGGTRYRLRLHDLQDRVVELNEAAARNARAAPGTVVVAGSMGPTGEILEPLGSLPFAEAKAAFAEQAAALAAGGADVLWIETMSDLEEVRAAVEGARSVTNLPICATMTFNTRGHTMMGVGPQETIAKLAEWGVVAIGANCGNGVEEIEAVVAAMHEADPDAVLIAKSNAGIPHWEEDELVYDGTPAVMADYARRVKGLGARLIGGCCGSTPDHIRAMAAALKRPLSITEQSQLHPRGSRVADNDNDKSKRRSRRRRRR